MGPLTYQCFPFGALSLEQLYQLLALRQEVFVVEQNCAYLDLDGRDQAAYHLLGCDAQGQLLAYTRLLPVGLAYPDYPSIGRVITAAALRGQGAGRPLLWRSIREVYQRFGEQPIKIGAQAHLETFYRSLGFEPTGHAYLEDGIPHLSMLRLYAPVPD